MTTTPQTGEGGTPRTQVVFEKALAAAERVKDGTVKQMLDALLGEIHDDVSQLERELATVKNDIVGAVRRTEEAERALAEFKENTIGVCAAWKRDYKGEKERGDAWRDDCEKAERALIEAQHDQARGEALEALGLLRNVGTLLDYIITDTIRALKPSPASGEPQSTAPQANRPGEPSGNRAGTGADTGPAAAVPDDPVAVWLHFRAKIGRRDMEGEDDVIRALAAHYLHRAPEGYALVPLEPGTCELEDSAHLFAFMYELHSNVPEDKRPIGWSDFSDEQRERIKLAYRAMLAAAMRGEKP